MAVSGAKGAATPCVIDADSPLSVVIKVDGKWRSATQNSSGSIDFHCTTKPLADSSGLKIICGGDSGEFEISVKSAQVVKQNLNPELFDSKIVVVSKKGWYGLLKDGTRVEVDKNDFSLQVHGHKMKFDVAFNAVHGEPGENGPLSGYLELLGIPCTSSPLTTCALTFHKDFCKRVVASYGVNVAPSLLINEGEKYD